MSQAASMNLQDARRGSTRSTPHEIQRWGTVVGGGALAIYGLSRRSALGLVMAASGGAIAYYAANSDRLQNPVARSTIVLNCSPEQAYRFWRDFENLPRFMHHLESVTDLGNGRSKWVALGPMSTRVSWEAEITSERENELIAWRSVPGSTVDVDGIIEFRTAPGNRGTLVNVAIQYRPPAGAGGHIVAKLFGKDPSFLMEQDLRRFKALVETGEIPTVEGQSHGPRDAMTGVFRTLDPDRAVRGETRTAEVFSAKRRVS